MRALLTAAVLALGLAACGEDTVEATETPSAAPPAGAAQTAPDAEAAPQLVQMRATRLSALESELLGRTYGLRVQLPPGYDAPENAQRRYPVLYVNDGPLNFAVLSAVMALPMSQGFIEEVIVVGVGYTDGENSTDSRARDYTPTVNPSAPRVTGEAGAYLEFFEQELIPHIEGLYRADPRRRALAGHSYGGLFGAYVLFHRPELFQHYILSSPSFWFNDNSMWAIEEAYAADHTDLNAKVYVSIGGMEHPGTGMTDYDMVGDVRAFEQRLLSHDYAGLELRTRVVEGQNHETVLPVAYLNGVLYHFTTRPEAGFDY